MKRYNADLTLVESIPNKERVEAPFSCDSIYLYHLHLLGCQYSQSPALKGFEIGLSPSQLGNTTSDFVVNGWKRDKPQPTTIVNSYSTRCLRTATARNKDCRN